MKMLTFDVEVDELSGDELLEPFYFSEPVYSNWRYELVNDFERLVESGKIISVSEVMDVKLYIKLTVFGNFDESRWSFFYSFWQFLKDGLNWVYNLVNVELLYWSTMLNKGKSLEDILDFFVDLCDEIVPFFNIVLALFTYQLIK